MCDKCDMDFDVDENPGALIFSPPFKVMVTGHTAADINKIHSKRLRLGSFTFARNVIQTY